MAAAAILYFRLFRFRWNFRTLLDGTVLWQKFEQSRTINTVVMTYKLIFKMAAAAILDLRLFRFR
jgi:hypothetical protein